MKNPAFVLIVLTLLLVGFLFFLNFKNSLQKNARTASFKDISPQDLDKILAARNF